MTKRVLLLSLSVLVAPNPNPSPSNLCVVGCLSAAKLDSNMNWLKYNYNSLSRFKRNGVRIDNGEG